MKSRFKRTYLQTLLAALVVVATAVLSACSLNKNTAASRQYSAFITRYNVYYNGDTHYKETLGDMERKYEDDFSRTIPSHPAEARADEKAPQPTGDFTRSIEKAQKAIQIRSIKKRPAAKPGRSSDPEYKAWMKRDEYNPFLHNAWMMMGRSQYMNGDFLGAASTFFYISKHFTWLPATVIEAKLWQARSYCAIDWLFEAETLLTRIKPEEIDSKQLRHLYNLTFADFWIKSHDDAKAIPYMREAVATASGPQKIRLWFLLGQLYASAGDKEQAYGAFAKAGGSASAPYRTKFNARIKQSEVYTGQDIQPEVKALQRMVRYDRNKEYLDQIYYAIGNLYLSRRDTANAVKNYELAVEKSTRDGIDKALAQLTLGGLYYDLGEYVKAQPCYSEAIPKVPDTYPDYKKLKRRSDYLDELAVYAQNVELQDSLLRLSYMTPEEQKAVAERLIEELKKKEKEEAEAARREEYLANAAANEAEAAGNSNAPTTYVMNSDNSWYFYNPSTVTAGKTEFQRRWGSRKLENDWRRRNKASFAFIDENPEEGEAEEGDAAEGEEGDQESAEEKPDAEALQKESDPHFVEYYLKQIPKDDDERAVCNDVIQEGLYNMGVILKDKLEDYPAAEKEFNELNARYPDNVYRLDAYYNLYLMYVRSGNTARAEQMRLQIIAQFPDSPYGLAMRDPAYIENLRRMDAEQQLLYDKAYEAYMDNRNSDVHTIYNRMEEEFPLSPLMPKFMFIDALTYVTEDNPERFKETLTQMLERYPDTDLTPYAASWVKGLQKGRKIRSGAGNMRGMLWATRLGNDSIERDPDNPLEFELNPDDKQLLILLFPTDSVSSNQLLYDVARHNFTSFVVRDFDLEQMNFGRLGLLIIKPFENVAQLNHYRSVMAANPSLDLPPQVRPVVISQKNFDTLMKGGGSFDDYFRYVEDKTYRDTEESVLPPEFFGASEGIPAQEVVQPEIPETQASEPSGIIAPVETAGKTEDAGNIDSVENTEIRTPQPEAPQAPQPEAPQAPQPEAPQPAPEPQALQPAPEPQALQPAPEPQTPQTPQATTSPALPEYPAGSEGDEDDPIFH